MNQSTRLKITIDFNEQVFITEHNVSKAIDKILVSYQSNKEILHTLEAACDHKSFKNSMIQKLIHDIAIQIMIKTNVGSELFLVDASQYDTQRIVNLNFFIRALFNNNLIVRYFMRHSVLWKPLFDLFKIILSHQCVFKYKFVLLCFLVLKTYTEWTIDHIAYFNKIELYKSLCMAVQTTSYHKHEVAIHFIVRLIILTYFTLTKQQQNTEFWFDNFYHLMNETLSEQERTRASYILSRILFCFRFGPPCILKPIEYHSRFVMSKGRKRKLCANCGVLKRRKNNVKLKICEGCRLVYYCSKSCQKYDWNKKHRIECPKLVIS